MPRVEMRKEKYLLKDFSGFIVGKMYGRYTQETLGNEFGVTQQGMGYKIRNLKFSTEELMKLFALLDFSNDEIAKYMGGLRKK